MLHLGDRGVDGQPLGVDGRADDYTTMLHLLGRAAVSLYGYHLFDVVLFFSSCLGP